MSVEAEYPPELARWVDQLEEWEWKRSRARTRAQDRPGGLVLPRQVTDFVFMALASGVIGNVGYELLKVTLRRWRRPKVRMPARARDMRDAMLLAVLATQARCAQVELPVPALDDLKAIECERLPAGWRVELRRPDERQYLHHRQPWPEGVALGATVLIPDGPLDGRDIEVKVVAKRDLDVVAEADLRQTLAWMDRVRQRKPEP